MTPEQKREILNHLLQVWLDHPALRLGQLLECRDGAEHLFYAEDYELINAIKKRFQ